MIKVSDAEFQNLVDDAMASLPKQYTTRLDNVAILYERNPSEEQRLHLKLDARQTLFGLFEGIPLTEKYKGPWNPIVALPDKITLFIDPLCATSDSMTMLKERVRHTLWHEIAHYFGLDHHQIDKLEQI